MNKLKSALVLFFLALLLVVGCAEKFAEQDDTEIPLSPTVEFTPTSQPVFEPTATEERIENPLSENIILPESEKEEKIIELLETNGGCSLPCWWGIFPGKTTWAEAKTILKPIAYIIKKLHDGDYGVSIIAPDELSLDFYLGGTLIMNRDVIEMIRIPLLYNFPIHRILTEYGSPDEIFVYSLFQTRISPPILIRLVLFYEEQGFLLIYEGRVEKTEPLVICPSALDEDGLTWAYLWSPEDNRSFSDFSNKTPFDNLSGKYLPLSEVTSINIETFQDWYRDPNNLSCFEMPNPTMEPTSP